MGRPADRALDAPDVAPLLPPAPTPTQRPAVDHLPSLGISAIRSRGDDGAHADGAWKLLSASRWQLATKRALDIVVALVALILLSPLLVLTSLAILVTSRGGILYTQVRVGRNGRPFTIIKFRTMQADADARMDEVELLNELDGPIFKIRRDPRVTPVGRAIRRFSVDELPQLVNVLRGDMSLAGPRPLVPEEYAHFTAYELQRLLATPGLTGIWQVSGRCDVDFRSWIEMDLDYIRHWNLRLDMTVLARTIPAVVLGRGSY
jgi:lipopolysaccharide/colanic/teichoic acid biosynthesis glycosyltransferase